MRPFKLARMWRGVTRGVARVCGAGLVGAWHRLICYYLIILFLTVPGTLTLRHPDALKHTFHSCTNPTLLHTLIPDIAIAKES